jgi:hypothetical protein
MEDKQLACVQCGAQFIFSASQQEHFNSLGFQAPKRCPKCRKDRAEQKKKRVPETELQADEARTQHFHGHRHDRDDGKWDGKSKGRSFHRSRKEERLKFEGAWE